MLRRFSCLRCCSPALLCCRGCLPALRCCRRRKLPAPAVLPLPAARAPPTSGRESFNGEQPSEPATSSSSERPAQGGAAECGRIGRCWRPPDGDGPRARGRWGWRRAVDRSGGARADKAAVRVQVRRRRLAGG
ncbi:hypothetical protein PAHAL_9G109200 [Panicum hallii]|uniref:Secreted protein n=1 Tax=Panicum hallii TaxID=206008 RepID=A0A2T8I0X9_9POAL|nr:hypothetical protein PAHAL_9G109200 [Panicum hallii]